jgi:hypothetical protein
MGMAPAMPVWNERAKRDGGDAGAARQFALLA